MFDILMDITGNIFRNRNKVNKITLKSERKIEYLIIEINN
jgi:hypothetical protein